MKNVKIYYRIVHMLKLACDLTKEITMTENINYPEHMVFGLDIGTRSLVGSVGYMEKINLMLLPIM